MSKYGENSWIQRCMKRHNNKYTLDARMLKIKSIRKKEGGSCLFEVVAAIAKGGRRGKRRKRRETREFGVLEGLSILNDLA